MSHLKLVKTPTTVKTGDLVVKVFSTVDLERDWTGMTDEAIEQVFKDWWTETFVQAEHMYDFEVESFDIEDGGVDAKP